MQLPSPKVLRVAFSALLAVIIVVLFLHPPFSGFGYVKYRAPTFAGQGVVGPVGPLDGIDWSRFAYVQYVTNTAYLCNSVMLFEALCRLGSKADRLMMYPAHFAVDSEDGSSESVLLQRARDFYGVKLVPIKIQRKSGSEPTWAESFTKLLAFNQTQYDRVLSLDSDATLLQHLDELFLSPPCPVALPRAYWLNLDDRVMSSQMILIQPSEFEFSRVMNATDHAKSNDYDMEIVNDLYKDSALILPHRPYAVLTGEWRTKEHTEYLGNSIERWDPDKIFKEAKYLHFSDWPIPKPWIQASPSAIEDKQPTCDLDPDTSEENCRARDLWLGFYQDFASRRQDICGMTVSRLRTGDLSRRQRGPPSQYEPVF